MPDAFYAGGGIGLGPAPVPAPAVSYPAPLVTSREGVPGPAKPAIRDMVSKAEAAGWSVQVTYARGWWPHARTGAPGTAPKESLAVRMQRAGQWAVAVYVGGSTWSWDTLWTWADNDWPTRYAQVGPFLAEVTR